MVSPETIAGLPFRALEKSTKNVIIELSDGTRFVIVGGRNRQPLKNGVAGFTPGEMMRILNGDVDEKTFRGLIQMKKTFGPKTLVTEVLEKKDAKP